MSLHNRPASRHDAETLGVLSYVLLRKVDRNPRLSPVRSLEPRSISVRADNPSPVFAAFGMELTALA